MFKGYPHSFVSEVFRKHLWNPTINKLFQNLALLEQYDANNTFWKILLRGLQILSCRSDRRNRFGGGRPFGSTTSRLMMVNTFFT